MPKSEGGHSVEVASSDGQNQSSTMALHAPSELNHGCLSPQEFFFFFPFFLFHFLKNFISVNFTLDQTIASSPLFVFSMSSINIKIEVVILFLFISNLIIIFLLLFFVLIPFIKLMFFLILSFNIRLIIN